MGLVNGPVTFTFTVFERLKVFVTVLCIETTSWYRPRLEPRHHEPVTRVPELGAKNRADARPRVAVSGGGQGDGGCAGPESLHTDRIDSGARAGYRPEIDRPTTEVEGLGAGRPARRSIDASQGSRLKTLKTVPAE